MNRIKAQSLFAFAPSSIVAVMCGLFDSSIWIAAVLSDSERSYFSLYYMIAVPCKAAVLLFFFKTVRPNNAKHLWTMYLPIGVTVFASMIMGTSDIEGVTQPVGTLVSLALTIMVLDQGNLADYMKAFGLSCLMCCGVFLYQLNFVALNTNGILEMFGRYSFISGSQPNFGGEVLFAGFVAFCIARLNLIVMIGTFFLYFIVISMLESRAAMLSLLLAFLFYIYVERIRRFSPASQVALSTSLALFLIVFSLLNLQTISNLLLLDDKYRGIGTGYVGREDHWESAWNVFLQSPIFGIGFGYFRGDVVTPHSMWLGMLSMMGAMSFFLLVAFWQGVLRIYAANTTMFFLLFSFAPMTIFNDRFVNLNPYPFLLFVILFLPGKAIAAGIPRRAVVRRRNPREGVRLGAVQ